MTQSSQGYVPAPVVPKSAWYHTGVFVGVSLMFCWPVGLFVLWTSPKTSIVTKVLATAIFGGFGFLVMVGMAVGASKKSTAAPAPVAVTATAEVPVVPAAPTPPAYKNSVALLNTATGKNAYCFLLESDKDLTERAESMRKSSKGKLTSASTCPVEGTLGYCVTKHPDKMVTARGYDFASTEALKTDCADWHETAAFAEAVRNKPVAVTAAQLHDAYHDNEVQADMQYKGRRLLVSGKVDKVSKDVLDKPFVSLATSNMFMSVLAYDMPESAVATLRKGTTLTLVCVGGGMTIGSPMLRECVIQ